MPTDLRERARDERERGRRTPATEPDEIPGQLDILTALDTTDNQHEQQQEERSDG